MKITIEINTENDAFFTDPMGEVTLILDKAVQKLDRMPVDSAENLYDTNGNRVGQVTVTR